MKNNQGMGLIGMLLAVVIVCLLLMAVLKQYTAQTRRVFNLPGLSGQQTPAPKTPAKQTMPRATKGKAAPAPKCNGRLVGNICVPTEVRSSSLDAFEQMNR